MRIDGLYFNTNEAKEMLKSINSSIDGSKIPIRKRQKVKDLVKWAMDTSAGRGIGGEMDCTAKGSDGGYEVTANVCCGGYAEIEICSKKVINIL